MMTQLEIELQEARQSCEELMNRLWRTTIVKWFAAEQRERYLEELDYLLSEIDEIANLVVSAKNLIRESKTIRAMLLNNGFHNCSPKLAQFISNESAISQELLLIQEMKDEKVSQIGEMLRDYNDSLRWLLEMRTAGSGRMWMSLGGVPTVNDFPPSLSVHLLSEFYEDEVRVITRVSGRQSLSPQNGRCGQP